MASVTNLTLIFSPFSPIFYFLLPLLISIILDLGILSMTGDLLLAFGTRGYNVVGLSLRGWFIFFFFLQALLRF